MSDPRVRKRVIEAVRKALPDLGLSEVALALREELEDADAAASSSRAGLGGQKRLTWALAERVKELSALHDVARLLNRSDTSVQQTLTLVANRLPASLQYPEKAGARIRWGRFESSTQHFVDTPCRLEASCELSDQTKLEVTFVYAASDAIPPAEAFLPEEQTLIQSIAELVGSAVDRRSAHERLELALMGTGAGVWEWDLVSNRVLWSRELEQIAGLSPGEFGGTIEAFRELVHPEDAAGISAASSKALDDPSAKYEIEFRIAHRSGGHCWLSSTGRVFRDEQGRPYRILGLAMDCTARRGLEERLRQAQKMEAIGGLAAGIAHDFNNVLSAMMSYSELLLLDLAPENPMRADVQEIKTAGLRAAELVRQLLAFSRQQVLQPRVFDLNRVLKEIDKLLRRLISEDIELWLVPAQELGRVRADPGQIEQVIVNLVVNARDAMPTGGKLSLETANVELDSDYAETQVGVAPGRYVMLAITDSGSGMSPEVRARVFEPFFTTKEPGKGTGLGLATVFGIVRQSGGHIAVYSELGQGTTFKIYLPRVDAPVQTPVVTSLAPTVLSGTETILLVEDEIQVRNIASRILRRNGYDVLEAQNGSEALLVAERHPAPIHLLLTDVVMPMMSGRKLAEHLTELRPEIEVVYMSGYTDDAVIRHGILEFGVAFVQKPLTPTELLRKVRAQLDHKLAPGRA